MGNSGFNGKKNTETEINSKKNIEVCKLVARHLYSRFWRYEHTFINVTKRKVKLGGKNFFVSEWVGGGVSQDRMHSFSFR